MRFEIKQTKNKEACTYKTLYIRRALLEQIECIAAEHQTNFNHVVVRMIEACLAEDDGYTGRGPLTPLSQLTLTAPLKGSPPNASP